MVKNLPSNAGDSGSVPGQETKIPHAPTRASTLVVAHTCPVGGPHALEPRRHNRNQK